MLCRYFAQSGQCFYGDGCKYSHDLSSQGGNAPSAPKKQAPEQLRIPCRNEKTYGFCKYEATCPYLHNSSVAGVSLPTKNVVSNRRRAGQAATPAGPVVVAPPVEPVVMPQVDNSTLTPEDEQHPVYAPLPHVGYRSLQSFFVNHTLYQQLLKENQAVAQQPKSSNSARLRGRMPLQVGCYHSLSSLDDATRDSTLRFFGYLAPVYKVCDSRDGMPYVLRCIEGHSATTSSRNAAALLHRWKQIRHPSVVSLKDHLVIDDKLCLVYDYHPTAETMEQRYFVQHAPFNESILWSYICQLVSALRLIHSQSLACRCIYPSKILVTGANRLRIGGVGVFDALSYDAAKTLMYQEEDLLALGKLVLCLACGSAAAVQNVMHSLDTITQNYSPELRNLTLGLLTKGGATIEDVCMRVADRMTLQMDSALTAVDLLENELKKEMDNGRLLRLITKLGFINERAEFQHDPQWSETGDRYLIKLFRDYVFHQQYEDGTPVVNWAHVVSCLNKLDAGIDEKVPLVSRDEQTVLVVSYKDLNRIISAAFDELLASQKRLINGGQ